MAKPGDRIGYGNPFKNASDLYIDGLKIGSSGNNRQWKPNPNGKYEKAAREGICFKCFRTDSDPTHRPANKVFAFCQECMIKMSVGMEKVELQNKYEVHTWFKD